LVARQFGRRNSPSAVALTVAGAATLARVPSTVTDLFAAAGVQRDGVVAWGARIPAPQDGPGTGVYVVALTVEPDIFDATLPICPLSAAAVEELLDVRRELKVDGRRPDVAQLAARLAGFWCPDEVVLYVGRAGPRQRVTVSELSDRVGEYYTTPLGARSPHAGGWPLKTLANRSELHVHYANCAGYKTAEERMLDHFAEQLSDDTREALYDSTFVMPFANLEDGQGRRKLHGIKGARAPKKAARAQPASRSAHPPPIRPAPAAASAVPADAAVSAPELARRLRVSLRRCGRGCAHRREPDTRWSPGTSTTAAGGSPRPRRDSLRTSTGGGADHGDLAVGVDANVR